jgi:hypothetical protein
LGAAVLEPQQKGCGAKLPFRGKILQSGIEKSWLASLNFPVLGNLHQSRRGKKFFRVPPKPTGILTKKLTARSSVDGLEVKFGRIFSFVAAALGLSILSVRKPL